MIPFVAGVIALAAAWVPSVFGSPLSLNDYLALMALSFVGFLAAGGFFFLGRKWMTAAAFPFAFLIFIVPMPDAMADTLERASALASAEAASLFFNLTGTPTLREGVVFQLPNIAIQVAQECGGIRSSWVLFITSLLAANLFLKSGWRRAVLVCFVIPLGIARNGLRVAVIGNLCVQFGPQMIHSIIHRRGGPLFFTLSLIPLFLLLWWLRRSEATGSQRSASGPASGSEEPTARREGPTPRRKTEFGGQRREVRGEKFATANPSPPWRGGSEVSRLRSRSRGTAARQGSQNGRQQANGFILQCSR